MINNVVLVGRLTKDIELKKTQSNLSVCNFTIAINNGKDEQGNERKADFIPCQAWRNSADLLGRYVKKGDKIAIEGKVTTDNWEKDGNKYSKTYVSVDRVELLEFHNQQANNQPSNQPTNQTIRRDEIKVDDQMNLSNDEYPFY